MDSRKKPIVIEFTGPPNSGKTSVIMATKKYLEAQGYKVRVMQEDAELVPKEIPKKTWLRNLWIAAGQVQGLIESNFFDGDVVLMDRGYYDALFWAEFLYQQDICTEGEMNHLKAFIHSLDTMLKLKPDYLYIINVSTMESLKRRESNPEAPVLSTDDFIDSYIKALYNFKLSLNLNEYFEFDTTGIEQKDMEQIISRSVASTVYVKGR